MITDFAAWRNRQLKGRSGWVMVLDPDEILSAPVDFSHLDKRFNYAFCRDDWFLGRQLRFGETAAVRLTRLIQPGTGKWVGKVHERFVSKLQVLYLKSPKILHRRKIDLSQFIDRLNWYSDLRARELNRFSAWKLPVYPLAKFVKNYFWHLGFLDGLPGLAMAWLMSLHSLMVRIKAYEKQTE
ncbi:hypothetical protein KKH13_00715 [Patescibacteria group bacterium]|nr:hypothetical protein [Patescibacteria group bacterium]